jgi:predicted lipoprotein with Yx(FWY)xxD motif
MMRFVVGAKSAPNTRAVVLLGAVLAALLLTSAGASAKAGAAAPTKSVASVVITTKTLPQLGTVLVNSQGYTLYMFVPDKDKKVTCVGSCAKYWPPVMLPSGAKVKVEGAAKSALLGSDPDPAGGRLVTYAGWPLYRWIGDNAPGKDTGQAVNINGGLWYVLSPAGKVITTKLVATTPPKTTTTTPKTTTPATTTTTPATTTPVTTTPAGGAPPAGPPYNESDASCPPGQTINTSGNSDGDGDELAQEPSDGDGCI